MLEGAGHNGPTRGLAELVKPMSQHSPSTQGHRGGAGWLRFVAIAITGVGVAALIAAAVRLSGGVEALLPVVPFMIWGLAPFALALFGLRGRGVTMSRALGVLATSGFGLAVYANLSLASRLSSTAGLARRSAPRPVRVSCCGGRRRGSDAGRRVVRRMTARCP